MTPALPTPPGAPKLDCGRSWFVLFGTFVSVAFTMGNALALGTLFRPVVERVRSTSGEQPSTLSLTVLFALPLALNYMTGMCAAAVTALIGYRPTIAIGASMAVLGFALSAIATRVWHLYLTMGILTGLGFGLTYTPAIGVLSYYFSQRYMNLAGGVAATGSSAGIMCYSRIHPALVANVSWTGAMLIEAALCCMMFTSVIAIKHPDVAKAPVEKKVSLDEKAAVRSNSTATIPSVSTQISQFSTAPLRTAAECDDGLFDNSATIITARESIDLKGEAVQEIRRQLSKRLRNNQIHGAENGPDTNCPDINYEISSNGEKATINNYYQNSSPRLGVATKHSILQRLFRPELFRIFVFYLLMFEGTAVLANFFFLLLTPAYLTSTQGWSSAKSAGTVITVYGATALVSRVCVCLWNSRPNLAKTIPKTLQIALGILFNTSAAIVFLTATSYKKNLVPPTSTTPVTIHTFNVTATASAPAISWADEPNAKLFAAFGALCGLGGTFTIAFQPPLLHEVLPSDLLTTTFGYMNLVLGVLTLALCPVAGKFADLFGTLRYAYAICLVFCFIGMVALSAVVVVILRRKEPNQRSIHKFKWCKKV